MTNARFDQALTEILLAGEPAIRLDHVLAEEVVLGSPSGRLDFALAEQLIVGSPAARFGQYLIECVVAIPPEPIMPTAIFPNLAGSIGWSVHRRPTFSTRVAAAVSGREVRSPYYAYPLWEFELTYDGLISGSNAMGAISAESLQALQGFFLGMQGQYGEFLFSDPENSAVVAGSLGTGDATTTTFPLLRNVGGYVEPIGSADQVTAVYLNGVAQSAGSWSVGNSTQVLFTTAPPAGVVITADFTYYFVCRFLDDVHDYEEFLSQIHQLQSCKFRSVRIS